MKFNILMPLIKLTKYNIKIIFGNKFMYFVLSAIVFYIFAVVFSLFSKNEISSATGYNMLLVPAILLIFYPTCFGIQNDQDAKIIEIIFGIPNYRYKIWLYRLLISYIVCYFLIMLLAFLTNWAIVEVPPFELTLQVMVPALFFGLLCFMLSTMVRNGNGTAVLIIVIGALLFALDSTLGTSKWNVFLNPLEIPIEQNLEIYYTNVFYNRIIVLLASSVFLLIGLYKTQNREKFI